MKEWNTYSALYNLFLVSEECEYWIIYATETTYFYDKRYIFI